jgi:HD-like signal output (HDOD) protein
VVGGMNTRIQELADQAKMSTYLLAYGTEFNIAMEQFAKLIVKECALTAGLMEHEGRPNIGRQILDNFGVES